MRRRLETALDEFNELTTTNNYFAVVNDDFAGNRRRDSGDKRAATSHDHELEAKARVVVEKLSEDIRVTLTTTLNALANAKIPKTSAATAIAGTLDI